MARARRETPVLITAAATAASARRLGDVRLATRLVVAGSLGFTPLVTALALFTKPRLFTLAALTRPSLHTLHAISHGTGVWHGCIRHLTFDPVVPDLSWRMHDTTAGALIELLHSPG